MPDLLDHVLSNNPRCLSEVAVEPTTIIEDRGCESIAFELRSGKERQSFAQVLGFDLRDYNPNYDGPTQFVSPLSIQWSDGDSTTLIFDSDIHGYHGEMESAAKLRGKGNPKPFACPKCNGKEFVVSVQFDYPDACHDLWEDEPEIQVENYFCNIIVQGMCRCGHSSSILDMDL